MDSRRLGGDRVKKLFYQSYHLFRQKSGAVLHITSKPTRRCAGRLAQCAEGRGAQRRSGYAVLCEGLCPHDSNQVPRPWTAEVVAIDFLVSFLIQHLMPYLRDFLVFR